MATMKAVRIHTHGGPETLVYQDAPRPEPAADEVLIRIHLARAVARAAKSSCKWLTEK